MLGKRKAKETPRVTIVEKSEKVDIRTDFGEFRFVAYRDSQGLEHLAIAKGDVCGESVLCRVHSECLTGEVFHSRRCECGPQLHLALRRIHEVGRGVVVYLRQEGRGIGLLNKIRAYALQEEGADTLEANLALGFEGDLRRYDIAADILNDLGVASIVLMSNNPDKVEQLQGAGIRIVRREPHVAGVHKDNQHYMQTKSKKMGHILPESALLELIAKAS